MMETMLSHTSAGRCLALILALLIPTSLLPYCLLHFLSLLPIPIHRYFSTDNPILPLIHMLKYLNPVILLVTISVGETNKVCDIKIRMFVKP